MKYTRLQKRVLLSDASMLIRDVKTYLSLHTLSGKLPPMLQECLNKYGIDTGNLHLISFICTKDNSIYLKCQFDYNVRLIVINKDGLLVLSAVKATDGTRGSKRRAVTFSLNEAKESIHIVREVSRDSFNIIAVLSINDGLTITERKFDYFV